MTLRDLLVNLQTSDPSIRNAAEEQFRQLEETNVAAAMEQLSLELAADDNPVPVRQMAGILLKNLVDAKERSRKRAVADRWLSNVDPQIKLRIKATLFATLSSAVREAGHTSAQVIAKIASIEMPRGQWDDLVALLLQNVTTPSSPELLQTSTLETLGYLCEEAFLGEMNATVLSTHSDAILTAVVSGMRHPGDAPTSTELRLAATTALLNAIEFVSKNFDVVEERNVIMETTCTATTNSDQRIRKTAYECLVKIAENYYAHLTQYMDKLFELTLAAIVNDEEPVALQAIEFWSSIAEEEADLLEDERAAREIGVEPDRRSSHYSKHALKHLCGVIFRCLMLQEEDQDEDAWNRSTAAGACLVLLAEVAPNEIVGEILPFVRENINAQDWRAREAATMAFGSILEGPPVELLAPLIDESVPVLQTLLQQDASVQVRDTAAWTLGKVCAVHDQAAVKYSSQLVQTFITGLQDQPSVAKNVCWAIHNFAECFAQESENPSGTLSHFVAPLLEAIFATTVREDSAEANLRASAYEALNAILQNIPADMGGAVAQCVPILCERLEATFATNPLSQDDREEISELQGLLCSSLQTATQKLMGVGIRPYADRMMAAYMRVFDQAVQSRQASVHEEALMAVGSMADAMERDFVAYMPQFARFLEIGLQNWEQYQVCGVSVGVVGDICRAIEKDILPHADRIVELLLRALLSSDLERSIKPPIFSCFGDMAMAIGGDFERYLNHVMDILERAARSSVSAEIPPEDYDFLDWVFVLRQSIFEAYTGIIQGLRTDHKEKLLSPSVAWVLKFCEMVSGDRSPVDSGNVVAGEKLLGAATGVLGDMVSSLDGLRPEVSQHPWVRNLVTRAASSTDRSVRDTAEWATQAIFPAS